MTASTETRPRPRRRFALIAGIAAFLVAAGSTSAWAYWTAQATASGTLTTSAVSVSQASFNTPASTTYLPSSLTATRVFTITNGSTISGTATAAIVSPEAYASKLGVQIWQVASAAACTAATTVPTSGVTTGTWASITPTVTLAASATGYLCARTSIADWKTTTDPAGGQSVNPVLSVSLSAQGWTATAPTATHVQRTAGMYPLASSFFDPSLSSTWFTIRNASSTGYCLDVNGSGGSGTTVLTWGCHSDANQRWQFTPVSGTDQSFVTIRPRHASATRLQTSSAGALTIQTATGGADQQWYVQQVSASRYQLVSALNGLCVALGTSNSGQISTVTCDTASAQLSFQRESLTFSSSGSMATVTWGTGAGVAMTIVRQSGAHWVSVDQIAAGDTAESFTATPNNATSTYRIVVGTYTVGSTVPAAVDVAFGPFAIKNVTTGFFFPTTTLTAVSGFG